MIPQSRILKQEISRQRRLLATLGLILIFQAILLIVFPLPMRWAIDYALVLGASAEQSVSFFGFLFSRSQVLWFAAFSSLFIGLAIALFEFLEERVSGLAIVRLVTSLRERLFADLFSRQFGFLDSQKRVDLLGRVSGDTQNMELFVSTAVVIAFRSLPSLVAAVIAMLIINWQFALVILLLIPAFYGAIAVLSKKIKNHEKKLRSRTQKFEHDVHQSLSAVSLIKSIRGEQETLARLSEDQGAINESYLSSRTASALLGSSFAISRHVIRFLVLLVGGWSILEGRLSLGSLFAFVSYLEALNKPVGEIANFLARRAKALASAERLDDLNRRLSLYPEEDGMLAADVEVSGAAAFELEAVSFRHENRTAGPDAKGIFDDNKGDGRNRKGSSKAGGKVIFSGASLVIPRSSLIAVAGPSGAGKSTLIKLFNRLHDTDDGVIKLFGRPLRDFKLGTLRKRVCVISQDPFFLSMSVRDNLSLGLGPVADNEIWRALQQVNADEFVRALPMGLSTQIGEGGAQLSGGQSKRLSLARGFLRAKEASVFVFDEPTTGLDPVSAQHVIESLRELSNVSEAVIFSTHRESEYASADLVLFVDGHTQPVIDSHLRLAKANDSYRLMNESQNRSLLNQEVTL